MFGLRQWNFVQLICGIGKDIVSFMKTIIMKEIRDYFNNDEEYLKYDSHELSSLDKLLDPDSPAPWDE